LEVCETKQEAALATDCGNQMVTDGVAAVLFNVSGQSSFLAKPIQAAGVPLFAWQAADIASDTKSTFVFSNGTSSLVLPAIIARDQKLTSAAIITVDVPGALGPAQQLGGPALKKAGVTDPDVVGVPHETADMGPQIQAVLSKNPQLVHLIGDGPFCTKAWQALQTAEYKGVITAISQCIDDSTAATIGSFLKGSIITYSGTTDPTDKDYQTFVAVVNKYVSDPSKVSLTSNPVGSFGAVSNFVRLMTEYKGDFSNADVVSYAKAAPARPLSLGAGATMKCDGKAVSILPAICTKGLVTAVLDEKGQPTQFKSVDPGDLLNLG
jgi:branched-chain amino acid transport system substrate-binding protein